MDERSSLYLTKKNVVYNIDLCPSNFSVNDTFNVSAFESLNNSKFIVPQYIRHLCRKTTVLSCHRCLFNTGIEK
jgi:hypothetical protein